MYTYRVERVVAVEIDLVSNIMKVTYAHVFDVNTSHWDSLKSFLSRLMPPSRSVTWSYKHIHMSTKKHQNLTGRAVLWVDHGLRKPHALASWILTQFCTPIINQKLASASKWTQQNVRMHLDVALMFWCSFCVINARVCTLTLALCVSATCKRNEAAACEGGKIRKCLRPPIERHQDTLQQANKVLYTCVCFRWRILRQNWLLDVFAVERYKKLWAASEERHKWVLPYGIRPRNSP